jgi:RluA family pseudouridine synthase
MTAPIKLSSPGTGEFWELPVLWEDDHLLALAKPARLLVSPDRHDPERPSLMGLAQRDIARSAPWARARGVTYLANAHRLELETTGVLLLARSRPVLIDLCDQFGSEKPVRTYIALAQGTPATDAFEVSAPLAPHPDHPGKMRIDTHEGKRSITRVAVRERFAGHTLVACQPLTERLHQVRLHLSSRRLPLVGDTLYGGAPLRLSQLKAEYRLKPGAVEKPLIGRAALHAERLDLRHPVTGAAVTIEAPWPKDLVVAVKYLRRYAPAGGAAAVTDGASTSAR